MINNYEDIAVIFMDLLVKELVYVGDFVQLVECCLKAKNNGGIYNVGNDFPHTFDEQIKVMCEVLNPIYKKSEIIYR